MIYLRDKHPRFAMEMEVLATLPQQPDSAELNDLVEDFGFGAQCEIRELLTWLRVQSYAIEVLNIHGRRAAWITRAGWAKARAAAAEYFDAVYGRE